MVRPLHFRNLHQPRPTYGLQTVSVLSGKGGVGKSVISLNLAERTASRGFRTLLVDADFTSGNLHVLANAASNRGLSRFAKREAALDELVRPLSPNLDLLTAASYEPAGDLENVKAAVKMARRLRNEADHYDVMILDHASGVSKAATVMAAASDINLIVVIPELTSISDGYGLCKYLYGTYDKIDCRLLLNRVSSEEESDYVRTKFSAVMRRFLNQTPAYAGSLAEESAVKYSVSRQQPIAQAVPDSVVCQALTGISQSLFGYTTRIEPGIEKAPLEKININPAPAEIRE